MQDSGVALDGLGERAADLQGAGRTVVFAAVDGAATGVIAIADAIRPTSRRTIEELHRLGVQVAMLTGDNQATAERIASELGLDAVFAEVLPGDKAAKVKQLQPTEPLDRRGLDVRQLIDRRAQCAAAQVDAAARDHADGTGPERCRHRRPRRSGFEHAGAVEAD